VTLTATASLGNDFQYWILPQATTFVTTTTNPVQIVMDADASPYVKAVGAVFQGEAPVTCYTLATSAHPASLGTASATITVPSYYNYNPCANGSFPPLTLVTLNASPGFANAFQGWALSGNNSSTANPLQLTLTSNESITATFAACVAVKATASPEGSNTVLESPLPNCQGGGTGLYNPGTQVQLTAQPGTNFAFDAWSGAITGTLTQTTVTLSQPLTATAHFLGCVALTTAVDPSGVASAGVATPHDCPGGGPDYAPDSQVALTSSLPFTYAVFSGWTATGASPLSAGTPNITLALTTTGATATAHYDLCYRLSLATVPADGSGGSISAQAPPDSSCGGDYYLPGTQVTLTALTSTGFVFAGWSGDATGSNAQVTLTLDKDHSVAADFQVACFGLTYDVTPPGSGSVAASPPSCTTAHGLYAYDTPVTLTATALPAFTFTGWSGAASGTLTQTTLTVTGPVSVTAAFAACVAVNALASPGGSNTVLESPLPNCQGGGTGLFNPGTQVQLTARPGTNFAFDAWSGAITGTLTQTTFTLSQPLTATAHFVGCVAVATAVDPPGVASAGVATPHDCPGGGPDYAPDSQVALTSSLPFTYAVFSGWTATGASPLSAGTPNITLALTTTGATATAHYDLCYQLSLATVPADGSGGGITAQAPPDSSCGGDYYLPGTQVTLTAQASTGFVFAGWSGDATGTLTQTNVLMTQEHTVTATFASLAGGPARQRNLPKVQIRIPRGLAQQPAAGPARQRSQPKEPAPSAAIGRPAAQKASGGTVTNSGATASWAYMSTPYQAASNALTCQVFDDLFALFLAAVRK
jgi:uncharacterized repeat protein (TIGR02543 family)